MDLQLTAYHFWNRVDKKRKEQGISIINLSKQLDMSYEVFKTQRKRNSIPKAIQLLDMARILHTDVEFLLTGKTKGKSIPEDFYEILKSDRLRPIARFLPKLSSTELDLLETFLKAMGYASENEQSTANVG